jgi:hypothetical protein
MCRGRIEAAKEGVSEENTGADGVTETLVIAGLGSSIEVVRLAKYPSHGGSQGFKSPHLHPTCSVVTGPAGSPRWAGVVPRRRSGQQTGSTCERPAGTVLRQRSATGW